MTTYTITPNDASLAPVRGYTLDQAAEMAQIDASEIEYAIEEEGECTTDEYTITEEEDADPSDADVMQDPAKYAAFLVSWSGSKPAALADFVAAVKNDPSFRLAPASWIAAVMAALT